MQPTNDMHWINPMSRAPFTFRQNDVTRAVNAVAAAGVDIARVEIDKTGTIRIITLRAEPNGQDRECNEWDSVS
jgi:hypothetical protein